MWNAWSIYSSHSWARSVLANGQAITWARAKVYVHADSVLCVGQMRDTPEALERWKGQVEGLRLYSSYYDAVGIDGEAIEFEWTIFPGFSSLSILREIQRDLEKRKIQPEEFKDRLIFMSMLNDIEWETNNENCISNAEKVKNYAMRVSQGHWTFLGPGSEEKWYGSSYHAQKGQWQWLYSRQYGATIQRNCSALSRGILKQRRDEEVLLWTTRSWPSWNQKKYNTWYLLRREQLETGCQKESRASTKWAVRCSWHHHAKILSIYCGSRETVQSSIKRGRRMGNSYSSVPRTFTSPILSENESLWQQFLKAQPLDQFWKFTLWKFLTDME